MQIKVILFLFAFRAVSGILEFSESENGEEDANAGSDAFDFEESRLFLRNISSRVGVFTNKGKKKFSEMEDKINNRTRTYEESLEKSLYNSETRFEADKEREIKKAVKKGKDETEIQQCLTEENLNLRDEMKSDIDAATECFNYTTKESIEIVEESRESFDLTVSGYLDGMVTLPFTLKPCFDEKNTSCVEKGVRDTRQNIKQMIGLGRISFQMASEAVVTQKQKMDKCREEFLENLRQVEDAYYTLVRQCVESAKFVKHKKEEKKVKYKRH